MTQKEQDTTIVKKLLEEICEELDATYHEQQVINSKGENSRRIIITYPA